ncbi:hypothetical protein ACFLVO_02360 [Chloroflexota bacterium]
MELGQYLVRELDFEGGVDTLGRWMANYLAELIDEAENGSTVAKRTRARKEAATTILKIWDHRSSLPGKAYPLSPYIDVLRIIDRLKPDSNPFQYLGHHADNKREQLAAELFDGLSRLIISLLLMKTDFGEKSVEKNLTAIEALSETEQRVLTALQQWGDLFESTADSSRRERKSRKDRDHTKVNLGEAAIRLIDSITTNLNELRGELQGTD